MTDKAKATVEATAKRFTSNTELKEPVKENSNMSDSSASKDLKDLKDCLQCNMITRMDCSQQDKNETNSLDNENETKKTEGFVCPSCMTTFQTSEFLESHFEGVHGNVCPVCMLGFNSPEKLQEHYDAEHVVLKENQFRKIIGQLTKRERTTSRTSTNSIDKPRNLQDDVELEGNFCPLCMDQFDKPEDLSVHYETVHCSETETIREKILSSQFVKTIKMMKLKDSKTSAGSAENIEHQLTEDESFLYRNQISALEESKALLLAEVIILRK